MSNLNLFKILIIGLLVLLPGYWSGLLYGQPNENVFWDFEFDGVAKTKGALTVEIDLITNGGTKTTIAVGIPVLAGTTPEKKAERIVQQIGLNNNHYNETLGSPFTVKYEPNDDDFKIKLFNPGNQPQHAKAIVDARICTDTGEDIEGIKDDPPKNPLILTGSFLFVARGQWQELGTQSDGYARIQIGDENPLIEVPTLGKTGSQIESELISSFNKVYEPIGFSANKVVNAIGIIIDSVPCPLGIKAGISDTAFAVEIRLGEAPSVVPCQLSDGSTVHTSPGLCNLLLQAQEPPGDTPPKSNAWILWIGISAILILIAIWFFLQNKKSNPNQEEEG